MRDGLTDREQQRLLALLAEVRALDISVDVRNRVLGEITGMTPEDALHLPTRIVGWSLAGALVGCAAAVLGMFTAIRSVPSGFTANLLATLDALYPAVRVLASLLVQLLRATGSLILTLLEVLTRPLPGGEVLVVSTTGFSIALMTIMVFTTFALLRRDMRRVTEQADRRMG